jgi:hypothetical protein
VRTVIELDGMLAVHATRLVFTALAGVPGIQRAEVELGRAVVHHDVPIDLPAVRALLEPLGVRVRSAATDRRTLTVL